MQDSNFDLNPKDWASLRGLLDTALELPDTEREAWVDQLDGQFAELKPRLRALLAHAGSPVVESLLNTLPKVETGQFAPPPKDAADDATTRQAQIGPYRLLRQIGDGGMASVWLAERTDLLQSRQVALKLPHGAWRRAGLVERMAREREILATLEHPNIARLYDAGLADDGQPYLALEYVEGQRIDDYCNASALNVRQRLGLFLQVTKAVAYAHTNLVVHRDLKPSNILVTAQGDVRLLDFGIAKLLDQGTAEETALTRDLGRALTPDYAAPEQIQGRTIGTAADVYSLGVVLFELLTGQRPYQLKRDSRGALEEAILQVDPMRPSEVVAQGRGRREMRGDLDTVVLRALKKVPEERYATVNALAEDIERWLAKRPVHAQPDSRWYRLQKFVMRHQLPVGIGTVVTLAILSTSVIAVWQARIALHEQERATAVNQFIVSIFRDADPYAGEGKPLAAVDLLQRARSRVEGIDPGRVELRAELMSVLGESLLNLGAIDAAQEVLARAVSESTRSLGAIHPVTLRARLLVTDGQRERVQTAALRAELDRLEPSLRNQVAEHPEFLVHALENRAHLEMDDAHYALAVRAGQEAFDLALARLGPSDTATVAASTVLAMAHQFGTKTPQMALAEAERGMRFAEAAHAKQPMHPQLIRMREFYAVALFNVGDDFGALAQYDRARKEAQVVFGPGSRVEAVVAMNSGPIQRRVGLIKDAIASANAADAIFRTYLPKNTRTWGAHLRHRGAAWIAARNGAMAVADLTEARDVISNSLGPMNGTTLSIRTNLALALAYAGRLTEAHNESEAMVSAYRGKDPEEILPFALHVSGIVARLDGRYKTALALQQEVLSTTSPTDPLVEQIRLRVLIELGLDQLELAKHAEALATLTDASILVEKLQRVASPMRAEIWLGLGRVHLAMGRPGQARALFEQADTFWRDFDPNSRWAGEAAFWLARADDALGQRADARREFTRAIDLLANSPITLDRKLIAAARRH